MAAPGLAARSPRSSTDHLRLHFAPVLEGAEKGRGVRIIEFPSDGHPVGDPRHLHSERLDEPRQVQRSGIALDGGVHRQDDLADPKRAGWAV